jgi:hypothetical protein
LDSVTIIVWSKSRSIQAVLYLMVCEHKELFQIDMRHVSCDSNKNEINLPDSKWRLHNNVNACKLIFINLIRSKTLN